MMYLLSEVIYLW